MNEQELKAWKEVVDWLNIWRLDTNDMWCPPPSDNDKYQPEDRTAILAADAELTRLREENGRLREAVEWALKEMSGESDGEWASAGAPMPYSDWFVAELRRRAEGGK